MSKVVGVTLCGEGLRETIGIKDPIETIDARREDVGDVIDRLCRDGRSGVVRVRVTEPDGSVRVFAYMFFPELI
jgi:hypothetical protein